MHVYFIVDTCKSFDFYNELADLPGFGRNCSLCWGIVFNRLLCGNIYYSTLFNHTYFKQKGGFYFITRIRLFLSSIIITG